jgi:hypothetical protein
MTFTNGHGRSTQALHALLELQSIQEAMGPLLQRQHELIEILNAIAFNSTHPEVVRSVMATRATVNAAAIESSNGGA